MALMCGNESHSRRTKAIAKLSYPNGRFNSTTGCVGCTDFAVRQALDEGIPIVVEPVEDWRVDNPPRAAIVQSRLASRLDGLTQVSGVAR